MIITADLNIHLENLTLPESARFLDLLSVWPFPERIQFLGVGAVGLKVAITREDCGISYLTVDLPPSLTTAFSKTFTSAPL